MGRWAKGADQVTALVKARHLQQVVSDPDTVAALLASARRHIGSARLTAEQDPEACACRKSVPRGQMHLISLSARCRAGRCRPCRGAMILGLWA